MTATVPTVRQAGPAVADQRTPADATVRRLAADAVRATVTAGEEVLALLAGRPITDPDDGEPTISLTERDPRAWRRASGWTPARVVGYRSHDPYHEANPALVAAVTRLIGVVLEHAAVLRETRHPDLTYLDVTRSRGGRRRAPLTQALAALDPGFTDWMDHLPAAERLRPVAHPGPDGTTVVLDESGRLADLPSSPFMRAIFIGSGDSRAVREREAWERRMVAAAVAGAAAGDPVLRISSLGTGTGEPAMEAGVAAMAAGFGGAARVEVHGYDISPTSLAIAGHLAERKRARLGPGVLSFRPAVANLLSTDGLRRAVRGVPAHVYESIGFMEYVPSDGAADPVERAQRDRTRRAGWLSAEDFYREVYEGLPPGAVLLTGNMRADSPQAPFVVDGLGWKGIILRSTDDYLRILEAAGIPGSAVQLFVPDRDGSAGVYNLVAVTKGR